MRDRSATDGDSIIILRTCTHAGSQCVKASRAVIIEIATMCAATVVHAVIVGCRTVELIGYSFQLIFGSCTSAGNAGRIPSFVGQAGNRTGSTVDGNRVAAAGRANSNAVGQLEADLVVGNRGLDIGITGVFDGLAQFHGVVRAAVGPDLETGVFQIGHGSTDGSIDCGINCTAGYGTVVACRNVAAGQVGDLAITHVDVFTVGVDTAAVDNRAVVNCQAVGSQVGFGGNGNVFTVVAQLDVSAVEELHGIGRLDGLFGCAVHLEFPACGGAVCLVVGCGNGIAEGGFARATDIVAAQITRTVDADVATQYVFHVIQCAVHLAAGRGIGAGSRNRACSYVGNRFTAGVDTGFGYARAAGNGQTVGIQFAVACRNTGYVQVVSQREADLVVGNLGFDVGIAGIFDGFTQCNGVDCAAIGINLQAFAFQCAYGIVHRCGYTACGGGFVCIRRRRCGNLARRRIRIQCNGRAYGVHTAV